jgi:hypothetical protein
VHECQKIRHAAPLLVHYTKLSFAAQGRSWTHRGLACYLCPTQDFVLLVGLSSLPPLPLQQALPSMHKKYATRPNPYMTTIRIFRIYMGVVQQECVCLPRPAPSLVLLCCWCNPGAPAPRSGLQPERAAPPGTSAAEKRWMLQIPAPISST